MRTKLSSAGVLAFFLAVTVSPLGCSESDNSKDPPASCPTGDEIYGQCAGVPPQAICEGDSCTDGVDCSEVMTATDQASLNAALSAPAVGTCIALAPGSYEKVTLPSGVSLLGKSAESVQVKGVVVAAGEEAVVRGVTVEENGVVVEAGATARLEAVRVTGATSVGIQVSNGAQVTLIQSSIEGGAAGGMTVADGGSLMVENSIVEANAGPGLWSACSTDCDCTEKPEVILKTSIVRNNHVGGVVLFATVALLTEVNIQGTLVGDDVGFGLGGGGLSAATCSNLTANKLNVFQNQSYGILIDDSAAMLGDPGADPNIFIRENKIGVWAQHISQSESQTVTLDGATLEDNAGVGVGVDGDAVGLIICRTAVIGTVMDNQLVEAGGSQQVGDGLLWLGGSEIVIDGLELSGNARASVVIDGEATGSMKNVTLNEGDEEKGIVQQSFSGGTQPQVGESAPAITTSPMGLFSIPKGPTILPKNL